MYGHGYNSMTVRTKRFNARLSHEELTDLRELATLLGCDLTKAVAAAVAEKLRRVKGKQKSGPVAA